VCKDPNKEEIYVGSTKNIYRRAYNHYTSSSIPNNKEYNYKKNVYIRENGGWDNFQLIKLCDVNYSNPLELRMKEQEFIDILKPTLNDKRAYNSREYMKIYRDSRKHIKKEHNKKYYLKNREQLLKKKNEQNKGKRELRAIQKKEKLLQKIEEMKKEINNLSNNNNTINIIDLDIEPITFDI
tara:strand:+ start:1539 stop:2084 length:546 start_codon:yes stop_codon:yes gene_type:complete